MKEQIIDVPLSSIKESFYVRGTLDQDRVLFFWILIDSGKEVPPIILTKHFTVIDGRHRIAAHHNANLSTIKAIIREEKSPLEIISESIKANMGGPLPNTPHEIKRAIGHLILGNFPKEDILRAFNFLPKGFIEGSYHRALANINSRKVLRAVDLINNEEKTVPIAAQIVGIPAKMIQAYLDKITKKDGKIPVAKIVTDSKSEFSRRYARFNTSNGHIVTAVFKAFDNGEIREGDADRFFKHVGALVLSQNRMITNWEKRWRTRKSNLKV